MTVIINQSVNISSLFWSMGKCLLAKVSAKWWKLCLHAILTNIVSDNLVVIYYSLKAVCHEMFDPFFSWFEPIWALINSLKYIFEFGFDFAAIFDHKVISAVCNIPRTRRCTADRKSNSWLVCGWFLRDNFRRNPFRGEHICHERKDLKYKILIY